LALAAVPVLFCPVLLGAMETPAARHSIFGVRWFSLPWTYRELLDPAAWPFVLSLLAIILAQRSPEPGSEPSPVPLHEMAALGGLAGLFAILAAGSSRRAPATGAALVLLFGGFFGGEFALQFLQAVEFGGKPQPAAAVSARPAAIPFPVHRLVSAARASDLPLVVSSGLAFLELDYYADAPLLARTYYQVDAAAERATGWNWFDATYPELARRLPLRGQVQPAGRFLRENRHFLLYFTGGPLDWLKPESLQASCEMKMLGRLRGAILLEVVARP